MSKKGIILWTIIITMLFGRSLTAYAAENNDKTATAAPVATSSSTPTSTTSPDVDEEDETNEETDDDAKTPPRYVPASLPKAYSHQHVCTWKITTMPTEEKDGLASYICECGHVEMTQPVSSAYYFIMTTLEAIETAPENGTAIVTPKIYRTYTDKIMEALAARPDVTLKTVYLEDGIEKGFSLTAADVKAENTKYYGFTYLGNKYGWE